MSQDYDTELRERRTRARTETAPLTPMDYFAGVRRPSAPRAAQLTLRASAPSCDASDPASPIV